MHRHMALKLITLIRQKIILRHKLKVERKEPLQSRQNHTHYILLRKMVHQRIPIEQSSIIMSFNIIQIIVSQRISIPQNVSSTIVLPYFLKSIFSNDVLESVQLVAALVGIDKDLLVSFYTFLKMVHFNLIELLAHVLLLLDNYLWFLDGRHLFGHVLFCDC